MIKTDLLCQVANTLYLNHYQIESVGLRDGQMGITWFMYQYARKSGWKQYEELGDYLLEQVLNSVHKDMNPDFLTGLAGIGWCIRYLIKKSLIEADDDVLENYNAIIYNRTLNDCLKELETTPNPVYTNGLYFADTHMKGEEFTHVSYLENILKQTEKRVLPICFLNSILYVYWVSTGKYEKGQCDFEQLFYFHTMKALQTHCNIESDRNILRLLIAKIDSLRLMDWKNLLNDGMTSSFITDWQYLIYATALNTNQLPSCDEQVIQTYIEKKLINLTPRDLSLNELTGWGLLQII